MDVSGMMSENVILVDAGYVDKVAFDLSVNFERMLGRRIEKADLANWLDCVALDGGLLPGENAVQVIFLHEESGSIMENFVPSDLRNEIGGKAFRDNLGEFALESYVVEHDVTDMAAFFKESLSVIVNNGDVKNVMVVADMTKYGNSVKDVLKSSAEKHTTLFVMEPCMGSGFSQQMLGYSLMNALGIRAEELDNVI